MKIENIILRRIIDSRGNPTVEAEIKTKNGVAVSYKHLTLPTTPYV